jgi:F0F1-type ATP synthase assembly protein I
MKLGVRRALIISSFVVVAAFLTAGVAGNNQSGMRALVGDVAWTVALIGAVVVAVLAAAALVQSARRRARHSTTP